ncbi:hypothetical protein BJX70DRAFT_238996 [Aspergillus crustosus]
MNDYYSGYSYWDSQTSSPSSLTGDHDHSAIEMNHPGVHTGLNMTYMLPDISMPSSQATDGEFESSTDDHQAVMHHLSRLYQIGSTLTRAPRLPSGTSSPTTLDSEYNLRLYQSTPITENGSILSMKRRTQNRAAQRRFRKRREDLHKNLEEKIHDLEQKSQDLCERYDEKTGEASRLQEEKTVLESEVQNLRKRWQAMVMLLQKPQGLQSLSLLFANGPPSSLSGRSPTDTESAGEELFRCLDTLIPNTKS